MDSLRGELEAADQGSEALVEEHGGEEGVLEAARNDKGVLNLKSVQARIKELERSGDKSEETAEELTVLRRFSRTDREIDCTQNRVAGRFGERWKQRSLRSTTN